jgi:hypothetical protein
MAEVRSQTTLKRGIEKENFPRERLATHSLALREDAARKGLQKIS